MPPSSGKNTRTSDRNSRDILKAQLEQIQKRINDDTDDSLKVASQIASPKQVLPFSGLISKRDKRTSMPVFAGSNAHSGVLTANSGKDMNFVVNLSENLLLECRRLQADNDKKSTKLKTLQKDYDNLHTSFNQLNGKYQNLSKDEESLKNVNWDLEIKLQILSQEFKELTESFNKNKKQLQKQLDISTEIKTELEEVSLQKLGLQEELDSKQQHFLDEIIELKNHVQELNDENDQLHSKVEDLTSEVDNLNVEIETNKEIMKRQSTMSANMTESASDLEVELNNDNNSLDLYGDINRLSNQDLESQTLKASLTHANQTIAKLKQQIIRLKTDHQNFEKNKDSPRLSKGLFRTPKSKRKGMVFQDSIPAPQNKESPSIKDRLYLVQDEEDDFDSFEENDITLQNRVLDSPSEIRIGKIDTLGDDSSLDDLSDNSDVIDMERNPLSQCLFNLSDDEEIEMTLKYSDVEEFAKIHNLALISMDEYESLRANVSSQLYCKDISDTDNTLDISKQLTNKESTPLNNDEMVEKLELNGYKVLKYPEFSILSDKVMLWETPTEDYLQSKAKTIGRYLVTREELDELSNPSITKIISKAEKEGFKVIPVETHEQLNNPPIDIISENASKMGYSIIKDEELKRLTEPDIQDLVNKAKSLEHILVDVNSYDSLLNPSLEFMTSKLTILGFVPIKSDEYQTMLDTLTFPKLTYLVDKAKDLGYSVISSHEYEDLIQKTMDPPLEIVTKYIETHNSESLVDWIEDQLNVAIVKKEQYTDMVAAINSPSENFLRDKASQLNLLVVDNDSYNILLQSIDKPTISYLEKKCEYYNMSIIDKERLDTLELHLMNPPYDFINQQANKQGFNLLSKEDHHAMEQQLINPPLEYLIEKASNHNQKLLSDSEYNELLNKAEKPNIDHLKPYISSLGYVLVLIDEYASIKNMIEEPSYEFLEEKSAAKKLKIMPLEDYEEVLSDANEPSIEHLKDKAASYDLRLLPKDEYDKLQDVINKPSLEFLREKADGFELVPVETFNKLLSTSDDPSYDFLKEKSSVKGYSLLAKSEYQELLRKTLNPSIDELKTHALKTGHVLVLEEDLMDLQNLKELPNKSFILEKAQDHGLIAIDKEEYNVMVDKTTNKESILKSIKSFGYTSIPIIELEALKRSDVKECTLQELESRLEQLGYITLSRESFDELSKPPSEKVDKKGTIELCEKYGLKPIALEEYTKLNESTSTVYSEDELIEMVSSHGNTVVQKSLFDTMTQTIEAPSLTFLEKHANTLDMILISKSQLFELESTLKNPSIEFLTEKSLLLGFQIMTMEEYSQLKNNSETPTKEFLEESLSKYGLVALSIEKRDNLMKSLEEPTLSYLSSKLNNFGKRIIDSVEYDDIIRKVQYPTQEELAERARMIHMTMVPEDEYYKMKATVENPEITFIEFSANKLGFLLIEKSELDTLKSIVQLPSLEFIVEHAARLDKVIVDKKTHTHNMEMLENPEYKFLSSLASKIDYVVISSLELQDLKDNVSNPQIKYLEEKADKYGMILTDKILFEEQMSLLKTPSIQLLQNGAEMYNFVLVDVNEYENNKRTLDSPEFDYLLQKADAIGYDIIEKSVHNSLLENSTSPSIDLIREHAKAVNYVITPQEEYEDMKANIEKPEFSFISEHANRMEYAVLPKDELITLRTSIENPRIEYLIDKAAVYSKVLIDKDINQRYLDLEETPPLDFLESHAINFGKVFVDSDRWNELNDSVNNPSDKFLEEIASSKNKTLVENQVLKSLKEEVENPSWDKIQNTIDLNGYVLITSNEYQYLKGIEENPSLEFIKKALENNDFVLLLEPEYSALHHLSLDDLKDQANKFSYIAIHSDTYHALQQPLDLLKSQAEEHNHVLVEVENYQTLLESAISNITKEDIVGLCNKFDLKPIPLPTYMEIISPESDKVKEYASQIGLVAIERDEYDLLRSQAEEPDKDIISKVAISLGLKLIKDKEYENLLMKAEKVDNCTKTDLERMAEKFGFVVISAEKYTSLLEVAKNSTTTNTPSTTSKVMANKEYFEQVIRQANSTMHREKVLESAKSLGFVTLSSDEYKSLLENQKEHILTKTDIYNGAKDYDLTVLPIDEYKMLLKKKSARDTITYDDLEGYASRFNLKLIPIAELPKKYSDSEYNCLKAVNENDTSLKLHSGNLVDSSFDIKSEESEYTDAMQLIDDVKLRDSMLSIESNTSEYIDALDNINDIHEIASQTSTITIQQQIPLHELEKHAKRLGFVLVASQEEQITDSHTFQYSDTPGLEHESDSDSSSVVSIWSESVAAERAQRHGMVLITVNQYQEYEGFKYNIELKHELETIVKQTDSSTINTELQQTSNNQVSNEINQYYVDEYLKKNDMCCINREILSQLEEDSRLLNMNKINKDSVIEDSFDFALSPASLESHVEMDDLISSHNSFADNMKDMVSEFNYVALEKHEDDDLASINIIDDQKLEDYAVQYNMKLISDNEPQQLRLSTVSNCTKPFDCFETIEQGRIAMEDWENEESLTKSSYESGLIKISQTEYSKLTKPLSINDIVKQADMLQYVAIPKEEYDMLNSSLTEEGISRKATEFGRVVITKEEYNHFLEVEEELLDRRLSKEEIIERARDYGLIPIENEQFEQIKEELASGGYNLTADDIVMKAAEFGLVPIKKDQFDQIKHELENPTFTKEQIINHAGEFNLVAIDIQEYDSLKPQASLNGLTIEDREQEEETNSVCFDHEIKKINKMAKELGFMCIPESAFIATSISSSPDINNVVVLPSTYYSRLLNKEQESREQITDDELKMEVRKRGFQLILNSKNSDMGSPLTIHTQPKITRENTNRSITSIDSHTARRSIAETAAAAAAAQTEFEISKLRNTSRSLLNVKPSVYNEMEHMHHSSFDGNISLSTMASLSEPSIIPVLTQTVIGEYLYKYYRRLGPFSSVPGLRHERYFWIHPYTLTLYWSTSNPVLDSPSSHKTRAAAILAVESVEDSNPYPVGLYHKSIIVKTDNRDIKFTCSTRQRHNIWLNSLRFLIQRNMNGIKLDETDDADNVDNTDELYSGKLCSLPGENSKATTQRLSTTRNNSGTPNLNKSSSMWSLK